MKNNIKKLFISALLCSVAILTVGCQKNDVEQNNNDGQKENINQQENVNNEGNNNSGEDNNQEETANISRGTWVDNVYTNDFINIKFNMPETWAKYSDEEIATLMNIGTEMLTDDQKKLAELTEQNGLYCMVSNDPATGANVILLLEKPALKVTPEFYLKSVKTQLESVTTMTYTLGDIYNTKVADQDFYAINATATANNQTIQQNYYVKAIDNYMASIIITTNEASQLESILNCFE